MQGECMVTFETSLDETQKYDCLINNSGAPLVSKKVQDLLIKIAPMDVQFIPTKVVCSDGILEEYAILNVTYLASSIDHDQSKYSLLDLPGGLKMISIIRKLVLKPESLGNHEIARAQEKHSILFISEKIKAAFEAAGVTGAYLVEPETYYMDLYKLSYGRDPETGKRLPS